MPTYEYQCTKCKRVFEVFHSITAKALRTIATDCQQCNNKAPVQRLIGSGGGVIFKGSGFYETDYRSQNYKAGEKAEQKAASGKDSPKEGHKDDSAGKKDSSTGKPGSPDKQGVAEQGSTKNSAQTDR